MRCARGRDATTRQDKTRPRDDETTSHDDKTLWCGDATERHNGATRTTIHSTTMQLPTKQADAERIKDATSRGKDDVTRGEQRRRRYFFLIHIIFRVGRLFRITFNVGIDSGGLLYLPYILSTATPKSTQICVGTLKMLAPTRILGPNWQQIDTSLACC
jgi:hypothetical protein